MCCDLKMPRTIAEVDQIAKTKGWRLNPDQKQVVGLVKAENTLQIKFGEYYCPCKIKRIPEKVCPCKDSPKEIEKDGHCHCQMFYKK
jgi:ferredoxin-thioredoxin reductase catalytic chain